MMMRPILLGFVFFLMDTLGANAQSYFQIAAGYTHTAAFSSSERDYRFHDYTVKTPFLIDLSFTDSLRTHFALNYGMQFVHREVSGSWVNGGNGSGTVVEGYGNVSQLFIGFVPEWTWGDKLRFHTQIGLQLGVRVQSSANVDWYTYGPVSQKKGLLANELFQPLVLRSPLSMAVSYPIDKQISIGLKYQLAMDISRSGNYFADFRNVDQSLLVCLRLYQL